MPLRFLGKTNKEPLPLINLGLQVLHTSLPCKHTRDGAVRVKIDKRFNYNIGALNRPEQSAVCWP